MTEIIGKCGICNRAIQKDENWHEIDCLICECCWNDDDNIDAPDGD